MAQVKVRKGASIEGALKKLKKQITQEGTLAEIYDRRHYEKPSRTKYKKNKKARFLAKLRAKNDY